MWKANLIHSIDGGPMREWKRERFRFENSKNLIKWLTLENGATWRMFKKNLSQT